MSTASDRRAPHASRIPFDGMVEVGGALGPSFEARAVNLSEEGMSLRTAYLPEVGQPVTCRFDAGQGLVVVAAGEVLWKDDMGDGGEFGIRFTNLDSASTVSLQRIVGMVEEGMSLRAPEGRKVRLHIDGLASPMRARVKGAHGTSVTAFSELGFLQVGKQLDLEDAATGDKRPALIDRVEVEVEQASRIPQLVVTLRYDDEEAHAAEMEMQPPMGDGTAPDAEPPAEDDQAPDIHVSQPMPEAPRDAQPVARAASATDDEREEASKNMKSAFARSAAKVQPALENWAKRAKTTLAIMAARAKAKAGGAKDDVEIPVRRTTAPAPGGGLHATGRKVIRGEIEKDMIEEPAGKPRFAITKKKAAIAGAATMAVVLAFVVMRKPSPQPTAAAAPPPEPAATVTSAHALPAPAPAPAPPIDDPLASAAQSTMSGMPIDPTDPAERGKKGKPTPFGNGVVAHGNVLHIKMDGPIDRIQGASQPSGFTVVIPGRKSLDSAAPLASKDPRIAAIRMANEAAGAELTVTFKDGVPNYQVKAKGDVLEMHLAKPNSHAAAHASKKKKKH